MPNCMSFNLAQDNTDTCANACRVPYFEEKRIQVVQHADACADALSLNSVNTHTYASHMVSIRSIQDFRRVFLHLTGI